MSHMGEAGETRPLTAAEGLELFAAQSAEQRQMWHEMHGLINARPIMPCMQYAPGMPSATLQGHFISPSTPIFNQQMGHLPVTIQAPPFTLNGFQSAAINCGPVMYPLQNSSLMNATSAGVGLLIPVPLQNSSLMNATSTGVGLPIPIEPSAVVPDISHRLGAKAWKQVVRDWEHPDASQKHFTALKDWKHEWHASSRQSQLWGQRRTIALEFIHEYVVLFQSQVYALTMYVGMGEMKTCLKKLTQNMRRG